MCLVGPGQGPPSSRGPRATNVYFYCYIINKTAQIPTVALNYFKLKMVQNRFRQGPRCDGGAYDTPPDSLIDWGWGSFLIPFPFDAFGVSKGGPVVWRAQGPEEC